MIIYHHYQCTVIMMNYSEIKTRVRNGIQAIANIADDTIQREVNQHTTIAATGDRAHCLYLVVDGKCSLLRQNEFSKKMFNAELAFAGDMIGEAPMVSGEMVHEFSIIATKRSTIIEIPYESFHKHATPELMSDVISLFALKLKCLVDQQAINATMAVRDRALSVLRQAYLQQKGVNGTGELHLSHLNRHDIAATIGCSREMAGKAIKQLSIEGLVIMKGFQIIVDEKIIDNAYQSYKPVTHGSVSAISDVENKIMALLHKHPKKYQQVRLTGNQVLARFDIPDGERQHVVKAFQNLIRDGFIERINKRQGLIRCTAKAKDFSFA